MNLSIIIPNYNGESLLKKNLPKIFDNLNDQKEYKYEVIVVDDASTDSSISYLEKLVKEFENLRFFVNEKNLGFSSTINKGVSQSRGEVIILLNSDVYPEENFLKPLL